jgi:hypothetical protein
MAVHNHPCAHPACQFIDHCIPRRVAAGRLVGYQNVSLLRCECLEILWPDGGGAE